MNTFKVIRRNNRRNQDDDQLYEDICNVMDDPEAAYIDGYCLPEDPEAVYYAMLAVENCFRASQVGVRDIGFEITLDDIEANDGYSIMEELLQQIGSVFYTVGSIKDISEGCMIKLLVHATSYRNGAKFLDNNNSLQEIVNFLIELTGREFAIKSGTYFTGTSADQNCYI